MANKVRNTNIVPHANCNMFYGLANLTLSFRLLLQADNLKQLKPIFCDVTALVNMNRIQLTLTINY